MGVPMKMPAQSLERLSATGQIVLDFSVALPYVSVPVHETSYFSTISPRLTTRGISGRA